MMRDKASLAKARSAGLRFALISSRLASPLFLLINNKHTMEKVESTLKDFRNQLIKLQKAKT